MLGCLSLEGGSSTACPHKDSFLALFLGEGSEVSPRNAALSLQLSACPGLGVEGGGQAPALPSHSLLDPDEGPKVKVKVTQ